MDLSIIMLDWSVRERRLPEVEARVDHLLTLGQTGLYRKHEGLNAGLVQARGRVVTICDSDAVYPSEFVASVLEAFAVKRQVLLHHEERCNQAYPDGATIDEIRAKPFVELIPNASACTSMLRRDALGFGGVDEHESYHGYICGQNELVWRLVNSGVPEAWHSEVRIYHFDHPGGSGRDVSLTEIAPASSHVEMHNLTGVVGFREGRLLPLVENADIFRLRMAQRIIGSELERRLGGG